MTKSEKRLSYIALAIFIGYILPFHFIPIIYKVYDNYRQSIERLQNNISKREKLARRAEYWKAENQRAKQEHEKIEVGLLQGNSRELEGANLQRLVNELAEKVGITLKSVGSPDTSFNTDKWVLVIQSLQFEASSETLMEFLKAVKNNPVKLEIVSLEVRSSRKKLTGTIKITGFGLVPIEPENL